MKKFGLFLGVIFAIVLHVGFILFGGLLFISDKENHGTLQEVELISEDDTAEKEEEKPEETKTEEIEAETEEVPDAAEIIRNLEVPAIANAPELDAASLSAIEAALSGQTGGGDFGQSMDFSSGGIIGGKGKAGALNEQLEGAFSLSEIDQKPRPMFQGAPLYPAEMRGKKVEGVVTVIFVVDAAGKVSNPRAEKSTHTAFEKPALDAVKKWKFEPGVKAGQRVACRMRVPIRFPPS
jgi:TonB family protein